MFENFDIEVCEVFKDAEKHRVMLKHEYVGTEHLLLSILKKENDLTKILNSFHLEYESFFDEVKNVLTPIKSCPKSHVYTPLLKRVILNAMNNSQKVSVTDLVYYILDEGEGVAIRLMMGMNVDVDLLYNYLKNKINNNQNLEIVKYGQVLNDVIDLKESVIGRDKEIDLIIETLLRKKKNNPILIGEAGVGKSAIVEQLSRKIINGEVPDDLLDCKIVMLEMGSLISGTRYRGDFEERLMNIINEIKENQNYILFIDEIHSMVNAGGAEGAISASDILKPYLARGDIKCIGATTREEYETFFSKDKALVRRFEPIFIKEPTENETIDILCRVKNEYIKYHKVNISDEVINVLVHLACIYFPNRKNPDKSLELLDSVMSYVKLKNQNEKIKTREVELKKVVLVKYQNVENGDYVSALKSNIIENKLKKEIKCLKLGNKINATKEDVIDVLEYKNNIVIGNKKINYINESLGKNYDKTIINKLTKLLKNKHSCITLMIKGKYNGFIDDLASKLNYDVLKVNSESNLDKIFNKVKYCPSTLLVIDDYENCSLSKFLEKITKDNIVEYKEEYISFTNTIIILLDSNKSIGFNSKFVSNIPIDEIISFDKQNS